MEQGTHPSVPEPVLGLAEGKTRGGHLPFKGGDRFEFAAARLRKKGVYRSCAVDGDRRHGELLISPLEEEMPAKRAQGGESHGRYCSGGTIRAR